jgi:N-acetylmuramic acid 6-phosphate etherase
MNEEDTLVPAAVGKVLPAITAAVESIVKRLLAGGRLFYIGTGTSGRLGVLDASECPPTFGVPADLIQGVIAGGYDACYRAVEASEDDASAAARDLDARVLSQRDVVVGIAASGHTPYTVGALEHAKSIGALTIAVTCVPGSPITRMADVSIVPVVGPEVITGSTRLKAGTAQKLVLNMISTATLTKLGYVSGNRMSNLQPRNRKLYARAVRILMAEADLAQPEAEQLLEAAGGDVSVALVMVKTGSSIDVAKSALASAKGVVQSAVDSLTSRS